MPASAIGEKSKVFWWVMIFGALLVLLLGWSSRGPNAIPPGSVSISQSMGTPLFSDVGIPASQWVDVVITAKNANPFDSFDIREVIVRVSDSSFADSGTDGQLRVPFCKPDQSILAWAPGYEIESVKCNGGAAYNIELTHLDAIDNSYYLWSPAANDCNTCHGNQFLPNPETGASFDEINEWFRSGHGRVFEGKYFETMYNGTSVSGKLSIPAQPVIIDNEWVPVPPEISHLYYGPGFRLDFPSQPGNCAYCHVPAAVQASQDGVDLHNQFPYLAGAWAEGVTCDVCHKVFEVILADDGNPFPDDPGILSYRFLRPNSGLFITGPFSNILTKPREGLNLTVSHHSTCTPVFSQSEFCAPCHYGKFGDIVVYNSFGEWRASRFAKSPADPGYRTCQDCHMSHLYQESTDVPSSQRQACSPNHPRFQSFDHNMFDFGDYNEHGKIIRIPRMVKGAAQLQVTFGTQAPGPNTLNVNVSVTNTRAGHKFPTDSPLRHLILVVTALDRVNTPLIQVGGERIPNWAGPGPISPVNIVGTMNNLGMRDYGGRPGKVFANLLVEEETNLSPGMAYWNEMKPASIDATNGRTSDTRLVPGVPDLSTYSFTTPDEGNVKVTVELFYRYAFYDLVVWKEWFDPQRADILVTSWQCEGLPTDPANIRCQQTEPLIPAPIPTAAPTPVP